MDELRESSLLFSIQGLLETERERVQREAREAERRHEEELRRVAEAAELRRVAEEREQAARARREDLQREHERLEQERADAMKRAAVERARLEAEGNLRLAEADQQRKHELRLAQLREEQQASRYKALSWASSAGLGLALTAALLGYFAWLRPAQARDAQRLQALLSESQLREQTSQHALRSERAQSSRLSEQVKALEASKPAEPASSKPKPLPTPTPVVHPPKRLRPSGPCRDNGDPLNGCLH